MHSDSVIVVLGTIIAEQRAEMEKLKALINELQIYKDSKEIPF
jgi:hypothetical protein